MKPDTPSMDELIDLYQQAQHDHTARTRLNEILRNHPTSRQQLSAFLVDEELLCEELQTEQIDQVLSHESVIPFSETTQPKPSKWWAIGGMAAALIIGPTITYQLTKTSPVNTPTHITKKTTPPGHTKPSWIARLKQSSPTATWKTTGYSKGKAIQLGIHELEKGTASIVFSNDVELIVNAPAKFDIKSDMEVILHRGTVRAKVGAAGHGFIIDTPKTKIRDLGTEFGISVAEDQSTEVHVFNGEVELIKDQTSTPELVKDGFAARWALDDRKEIELAPESSFPTFKRIRYQHWLNYKATLLKDPNLVAYYDFSPGEKNDTLLNNAPDSEVAAGKINHPIWVQGRWNKTKALLFESPEDFVELELPTFNTAFTMQAWVKPTRYDNSLQVVLNSQAWNNYGHHWQITNTGALRVGVGHPNWFGITGKNREIKLGHWNHLAVTADFEKKRIVYYVNGILSCTHKLTHDKIRLGKSHIGTWYTKKAIRGFRGRMDELTIHHGAFSESEIYAAYVAGLPDE